MFKMLRGDEMKKNSRRFSAALLIMLLISVFRLTAFADDDTLISYSAVMDSSGKPIDEFAAMEFISESPECVIPKTFSGKPVTYIADTFLRKNPYVSKVTIEGDPLSMNSETNEKYDYLYISDSYNLSEIEAAGSSTAYASENGVLFSKDMKTLYQYPGGKNQSYYVIPDTVTRISANAFQNAQIAVLCIPSSVKEIDENVFDGCNKLQAIYYQCENGDWSLVNNKSEIPDYISIVSLFGSFPEGDIADILPVLGDYNDGSEIQFEDTDPFDYTELYGDLYDDSQESSDHSGVLPLDSFYDGAAPDFSEGVKTLLNSVLGALIFLADAVGILLLIAFFVVIKRNKAKGINDGAVIPGGLVNHITQPDASDFTIGDAEPLKPGDDTAPADEPVTGTPQTEPIAESTAPEPTGSEGGALDVSRTPIPEISTPNVTIDHSPASEPTDQPAGNAVSEAFGADDVTENYEAAGNAEPEDVTGLGLGLDLGIIMPPREQTPEEENYAAPTSEITEDTSASYDPSSYTGAYSGKSEYSVRHDLIEGQPYDGPMSTVDPDNYTGVYSGDSSYSVVCNNPEDSTPSEVDPSSYTGSYAADQSHKVVHTNPEDEPKPFFDPQDYSGSYSSPDGIQGFVNPDSFSGSAK